MKKQGIKENHTGVINPDLVELYTTVVDTNLIEQMQINVQRIEIENDIVLENQNNPNIGYQAIYNIIYNGFLFSTLGYGSRNKMNNPNLTCLTISNSLLYTSSWTQVIDSFIADTTHYLDSFRTKKIDLAYDTDEDLFMKIEEKRRSKVFKKVNEKVGFTENDQRTHGYLQIGSRKSDKLLVLYNKSSEIEASNKQYIRDYWKSNSFDLNKRIYRLELRLKGSAITRYNYDWRKLEDKDYLRDTFTTELNGYFGFKYIGGSRSKKYYKTIGVEPNGIAPIINFKARGGTLLAKAIKYTPHQVGAAKRAVNFLRKEIAKSGEHTTCIENVICMLRNRYDLQDYRIGKYNLNCIPSERKAS